MKDMKDIPIYIINCHGVQYVELEDISALSSSRILYNSSNTGRFTLMKDQYFVNVCPLQCNMCVENVKERTSLHNFISNITPKDLFSKNSSDIFNIRHKYKVYFRMFNEFNTILYHMNDMYNDGLLHITALKFNDDETTMYLDATTICETVRMRMPRWKTCKYTPLEMETLVAAYKELCIACERMSPIYKSTNFKNVALESSTMWAAPNHTIIDKSFQFYDKDDSYSWNMGVIEISDKTRDKVPGLLKEEGIIPKGSYENITNTDKLYRIINYGKVHHMKTRYGNIGSGYISDVNKEQILCKEIYDSILKRQDVPLSRICEILGEGIYIALNCNPMYISDINTGDYVRNSNMCTIDEQRKVSDKLILENIIKRENDNVNQHNASWPSINYTSNISININIAYDKIN